MADDFVINPDDPDDLRRKRPRAIAEAQKWQARVAFIDSQLPTPGSETIYRDAMGGTAEATGSAAERHSVQPADGVERATGLIGSASVGDMAVAIVNREIRPISPDTVRTMLKAEGYDFTGDQVSNAMHYAAETAKRIRRLKRGIYAPLAYKEIPLPSGGPAGGNGHVWPASPVTLDPEGTLHGR